MTHFSKFALLLLFFNQGCLFQKDAKNSVDSTDLQEYSQSILEEYKIPAIQAVLVSGTKVLQATAVGVKQIKGAPIELHSKMHLGSCGKAMTGYLAGILVKKNFLNWESTIQEIFPDLKEDLDSAFMNVSLQELLSHQSQLPAFITDKAWQQLHRFTEENPRRRRYDFTKWILQKAPIPFDSTQIKAGFRYSNAGYAIAAAMLEKATGDSWENLMNREVFAPLSIDATFGWPATKDKTQAFGQLISEESGILIPHDPNGPYQIDPILSPAGNISMSILDYSKFIQKNLNGLNGLDPAYTQEFFEFLHYVNRPASEYSIGWYSVNQFDDILSTHTGSADTFYCLNLLFKKRNLAVIVIANAATEQTIEGCNKIRNYLIRPYLKE